MVEAAGGTVTPESIASLSFDRLRAAGLSKQKASYVLDLAERTARAELAFEQLLEMEDEHVIDHLTQVKGVGVWTVHMFLMFAMRRPNVLPVGDLGIQNAVKKAYKLRKKRVTPKDVARVGKRWEPYCSVAAWYLWRSLEL
jgi:DNA-3-methyladenine glycosylase II